VALERLGVAQTVAAFGDFLNAWGVQFCAHPWRYGAAWFLGLTAAVAWVAERVGLSSPVVDMFHRCWHFSVALR
jgi:hypothetical protein